jgi:hypothetical protein
MLVCSALLFFTWHCDFRKELGNQYAVAEGTQAAPLPTLDAAQR